MGAPVKLYIYDLSNGMARMMSRQLTGTQIDGVWHTSIVAFGKEVYYGGGTGIEIARPGGTHLGRPLEMHDLGETEIDESTFWEYIDEMRDHYKGEKYHLLEFNCNSFTNDVAGFLTGGSIPSHIKDLPATFLSTPFGQQLRPMIDQMYARGPSASPSGVPAPGYPYPTPAATPPPAGTGFNPQLASSLLQSVAAQAAGAGGAHTESASLVSQLHISTNQSSLDNILSSHRVTAVLMTSTEDKALETTLESVARAEAQKGIVGAAFVKMDIGVTAGGAGDVARRYVVERFPALVLFRGKEVVSKGEIGSESVLRESLTAFLRGEFPAHPHTSLKLPSLQALSIDPILYTQLPSSFDVPLKKLLDFVDSAYFDTSSPLHTARTTLKSSFGSWLKRRFPAGSTPAAITGLNAKVTLPSDSAERWVQMTRTILEGLDPGNVFPLVDLWRVAILDAGVSARLGPTIVPLIEGRVVGLLRDAPGSSPEEVPRALLLTTLRLVANSFAHSLPGVRARAGRSTSTSTTTLLVSCLLHPDTSVRTAAASVAFNLSAQRHAPFRLSLSSKGGEYNWAEVDRREKAGEGENEGESEVELVVALLEAIEREESEEVVHRLAASLALLLYLSPSLLSLNPNSSREQSETNLKEMLSVLGAREKLKAKLLPGGCGPKGIVKEDVRKLVGEVADLC